MRTIETKVYQYDELTDEAKQKAREWYANTVLDDPGWCEGAIEYIADVGKIVGIIVDSKRGHGYSLYFDLDRENYVTFDGMYRYEKGWREAVRKEWGKDALTKNAESITTLRFLQEFSAQEWALQAPYFWGVGCDCKSGNHGEQYVDTISFFDHGPGRETLDLIRTFREWAWDTLSREAEWWTEDARVEEAIRENEYEFDEAGNQV